MVDIRLDGKNAVITGAGRGIGRAIALKLASAGANVMIVDVNLENAQEVAKEACTLGVKAKGYRADVRSNEEMQSLVADVVKEFGSLDIMCNNAGINKCVPFVDCQLDEFSNMIDVNLKGVFNGCQAAVHQMLKQESRGKIVNTASAAGKKGYQFHAMYSPTKFGVIGLTQVVATELAAEHINVNCICPGIVRTDMWEQNLRDVAPGSDSDPALQAKRNAFFDANLSQMIPMGRPQTAEDMANAVLFLCSSMADNITGEALNINGGQLFH